MPRAFTDVTELEVLAGRLENAADGVDDRARRFIEDASEDVRRRMRREVPIESGETRESITVDNDGLSASVGPTNRDRKGRPVGFFIEYGTGRQAPDPFVRRTAEWAERTLPDRAASEVLGDVL